MRWKMMNKKQFNAVVDFLKDLGPYSDEQDQLDDATEITKEIENILKKNADEKIVMPKVFDEWYKSNQDETTKRKLIHFYMDATFNASDEMKNLVLWLKGNEKKYDDTKFVMCFEAIIHDYEVEK